METIWTAFSMFSALPVPHTEWKKETMRYTLLAFPLIGLVIGLLCVLWSLVCEALLLPQILRAAGLCAVPVLVTGGIHLDGFADTWDARSSHGTVEKKQEILKDPHIGTFAVIHVCVYFLITFALWTALPQMRLLPVFLSFALSRVFSGLSLTMFEMRPGSGLARTFADAAEKKRVRTLLTGAAAVLSACICLGGGWLMIPAVLLVFFRYRGLAEKSFGGLSGDLAGWFVQTAELWMLGALCLQQFVRAAL